MTLLANLYREKASKLKDFNMKNESEFSVGYSTGFLSFDFLNGTAVHVKSESREFSYYSVGITDGSMVMVIGRSASGKTTWTIQTAANIIRPFKTAMVMHDDIEGGINPQRLELLTNFFGDELTDRYIIRNSGITAENFYERIKMLYDIKMTDRSKFEYDTGLYDTRGNRLFKLEPTVYILDSLSLMMPEKYVAEDELSGQMSTTAGARANAMIFRRLMPMLKSANIILFIINHINQKVELSMAQMTKNQVSYLKQGETLPGGNVPVYLSNTLIRFDDNSKLKPEEGFHIKGSLVDVSLVKSRTSAAGRSVTLVFEQDKGFDTDLSLFLLLKEKKMINGAGAFLYIGDRSDIKFSQKEFKNKLKENPELKEIFMTAVMDALKSMVNQMDNERFEANQVDTMANDILSRLNNIAA